MFSSPGPLRSLRHQQAPGGVDGPMFFFVKGVGPSKTICRIHLPTLLQSLFHAYIDHWDLREAHKIAVFEIKSPTPWKPNMEPTPPKFSHGTQKMKVWKMIFFLHNGWLSGLLPFVFRGVGITPVTVSISMKPLRYKDSQKQLSEVATLPITNSILTPLKIEERIISQLPTIYFQVRWLLVSGW